MKIRVKDWDAVGLLLIIFGSILALLITRSPIVIFIVAGVLVLRVITILIQLAFFD